MLLGSHLSTAGGLHKAVEAAAKYDFRVLALFVRNQVQWKAPPLADEAVKRFHECRKTLGIHTVVAHASYLINLAGNDQVRNKSIDAMIEDLSRCRRLGIEYLVFHPGSHPCLETGIERIGSALNTIMSREKAGSVRILLETTAGQGNSVGHRFEHLKAILDAVKKQKRIGVCLDTCHIFAAGYDLRTPEAYSSTMREFDRVIGFRRLKAIHLNDSKRIFASRVDRHEHIGKGALGLESFAQLLSDDRLAEIPMILETPKGKDSRGRDWDRVNAKVLRKLIK